MKILDIYHHLSMRDFVYEFTTSDGKYYLKLDFPEENITIFKSMFPPFGETIDVDPIEFYNIFKDSECKNSEDTIVRNSLLSTLRFKFLERYRDSQIDKLID